MNVQLRDRTGVLKQVDHRETAVICCSALLESSMPPADATAARVQHRSSQRMTIAVTKRMMDGLQRRQLNGAVTSAVSRSEAASVHICLLL